MSEPARSEQAQAEPAGPSGFEELRVRVAKLNKLLEDPRPGLVSWAMCYAEHMKWISDYWRNN